MHDDISYEVIGLYIKIALLCHLLLSYTLNSGSHAYVYYTSRGAHFAHPLLHPICISHHVDLAIYTLHAIELCKQGCERVDLAAMKRS